MWATYHHRIPWCSCVLDTAFFSSFFCMCVCVSFLACSKRCSISFWCEKWRVIMARKYLMEVNEHGFHSIIDKTSRQISLVVFECPIGILCFFFFVFWFSAFYFGWFRADFVHFFYRHQFLPARGEQKRAYNVVTTGILMTENKQEHWMVPSPKHNNNNISYNSRNGTIL